MIVEFAEEKFAFVGYDEEFQCWFANIGLDMVLTFPSRPTKEQILAEYTKFLESL